MSRETVANLLIQATFDSRETVGSPLHAGFMILMAPWLGYA
jgi:hypothetical protein